MSLAMTFHRGLESPGRNYLNRHKASAEWRSRDRTTHLDNEHSLETWLGRVLRLGKGVVWL